MSMQRSVYFSASEKIYIILILMANYSITTSNSTIKNDKIIITIIFIYNNDIKIQYLNKFSTNPQDIYKYKYK